MVKHRLGRRGGQFLDIVIADMTPHHVPLETVVSDVSAVLGESPAGIARGARGPCGPGSGNLSDRTRGPGARPPI